MDSAKTYDIAQQATRGRMLDTLRKKLHPEHTALVVIDVQNDFCAGQGMMAVEGFDMTFVQSMAARLPQLLDCARAADVLVVFVRNIYNASPNLYLSDVWLEQAARKREGSYVTRPVCVANSWGADFFADVRPLATEAIVTKHRYSAFHNTDLETILRANGIRTVVLSGCATNVCVETSAREAFLRDYYVVIAEDGTAGYALEKHESTLKTIDLYFGEVASIADVVSRWEETSPSRGTIHPPVESANLTE
jgi:ureidoacrylate peracid hydrolase